MRLSVGCTTNTSETEFSVHTGVFMLCLSFRHTHTWISSYLAGPGGPKFAVLMKQIVPGVRGNDGKKLASMVALALIAAATDVGVGVF